MSHAILLLLAVAVIPGLAQLSPEVHPDRRVTFRLRAPNAREVVLDLDGSPRGPMQKDEHGVWSVTTGALDPDLYSYGFVSDGVTLLDPSNPRMKPNLLSTRSVVHVPGPASLPWEIGSAPRGSIHRHFYRSGVVGDQREFYVYTPPGYDPKAQKHYPALYLLHGYSDDAGGWTAVGRAHVILDNLIAPGKAKPMLVVMPSGYGAPEIVVPTGPFSLAPGALLRNYEKFREALLSEVIPEVEKTYSVSKNRNDRAIAGLSMGGTESLYTGLNRIHLFAWIGAFSSGGLLADHPANFPGLDAKANAQLRLLWISCGKEDRLIDSNRSLLEFLKSKDIRFTWTETAGAHTWMVWRRNLAQFAPLLFQEQ